MQREEAAPAGGSFVLVEHLHDLECHRAAVAASQTALVATLDRFTEELHRLQRSLPDQAFAQAAARVPQLQKRVVTASSTIKGIEKRLDRIEQLLSKEAARGS
ncbi:hypothetical protein WJX72_004163 [[Myrmecia] bisecta]|uniref:Biogenesis of lysosome-related organelles complex 1 subunit 7 n=1 Tax=[Myrmecia] bisecta TaxID=41462 RepID=A0AAW1QEW5_9CHLO